MASNTTEDVKSFLNKVEEIESIVKGLNSGDDQQLKTAMHKADEFLKSQKTKSADKDEEKDLPQTTTGFSKTVINKRSGEDGSAGGAGNMDITDQNSFLAALEADAKERSERRKVNEKEAQVLKEKGNQAFKENNFEKALDLYNQAIDKIRDNPMLYTNRAQALIKLGKYEEALKDCDWALRANPNTIKAHVHMGRAHLALEHYQEARDSFSQVLTIDPKKQTMVQEYLEEVSRAEAAQSAEQKARELFAAGDTEAQGLVEVLKRVQAPDRLPMYYSGGLRVLCSQLDKEDNQAQFRMNGGLQLFHEHKLLCRCLAASPQSLSREERDLLTAAFDTMTQACTNNDCNQEQLLKQEGLAEHMMVLLSAVVKGHSLLKAILTLLFTVSQSHHGRSLLIQHFCVLRLVSVLFDLIRSRKIYSQNAASVLNNLSLEKKFRCAVRDKVEEILPSFEELLKDSDSKSRVVSSCISAMMNLANDQKVRTTLSQRRPLWLATEELLVRTSTSTDSELLSLVLGLLANMTTDSSPTLLEFGQRMCAHCHSLLPSQCPPSSPSPSPSSLSSSPSLEQVPTRALLVMGNILPHSVPAVEWVSSHGATELLLGYVKCEEAVLVKQSVKCLTALTQFSTKARTTLVDNKGISALTRLLQSKDEGIVGNAVLCLSHCTQVPGVCAFLAETDIVKQTLVWARDGRKSAVQQNCGILLAKLATGHPKNLERLRELHGIQILHDCMKHIK
ncbi:tetratricopeptide repeat protein 12-like [Babylonia areolata]|uniref:tetratricopeptide repeat protein 12-like n=1 Tax=Babylonia areolata TaxID=304850 RepID=UPI003FD24318